MREERRMIRERIFEFRVSIFDWGKSGGGGFVWLENSGVDGDSELGMGFLGGSVGLI